MSDRKKPKSTQIIKLPKSWISEPNEIALFVIMGHMLYPGDQPQRNQVIDSMMIHMALRYPDTVKTYSKQLLVKLLGVAAHAWTVDELCERSEARQYDGTLVGMMVCLLLNIDRKEHRPMSKKDAIDAVLEMVRGKGKRRIDRRRFDDLWEQMRPTAHLWAAHCLRGRLASGQQFPCVLEELPSFVRTADMILKLGRKHKLGGGPRPFLLDDVWHFGPAALKAAYAAKRD